MTRQDRRKILKGMAGAGVAATAALISFAADIVPSGPTAVEADASIVPACSSDVSATLGDCVGSFADSDPGRINSNPPCGFGLFLR